MNTNARLSSCLTLCALLPGCVADAVGPDTEPLQQDSHSVVAQELRGTRQCRPRECGPQLGMPNYLCPDGVTWAGPTDRCLRQPDGSCGWEVISCPPPPVGSPCASSQECAEAEYCTTEDGVCNPPPGCGPSDACPAVCYGVCAPKTPNPCAGKRCGDPCDGPFGSPLPTYCDEQGQCRPLAEPPICAIHDCDLSHVLCDAPEPLCPPGQTPSVAGSCYGACVPVTQCKCSPDVPTTCPRSP